MLTMQSFLLLFCTKDDRCGRERKLLEEQRRSLCTQTGKKEKQH